MPLVPSQVALNIRNSAVFPPFDPQWVRLTEAIGLGVVTWASANPVNLYLVGAAAGTLGAGTVQGKLIVPPEPGVVIGAFMSAGIVGVRASEMATAISLGVSMSFTQSGMYMGPVAGASAGVDVSKVVSANAPTLIGQIQGMLSASMILGIGSVKLATACGNGIAANLMLGTGTGPVVPLAPGPLPGAGTSPTSMVV